MFSMSRTKLLLTGITAALALGCQADEDEADILAQGVPCDPSIDAGVGGPGTDGSIGDDVDGGTPDGGDSDAGPEPAPPVAIKSVKGSGNGCPAGTWEAAIAPNGGDFRVTFDNYTASVQDGTRTASRDCNLRIEFGDMTGYQVAIVGYESAGHAVLEEGVSASQSSRYFFQGVASSAESEKRTDLAGPIDRDYLFHDEVAPADAAWSPCGLNRLLNISTRLYVSKTQDEGTGSLSVKELRGPKLAWRTCR